MPNNGEFKQRPVLGLIAQAVAAVAALFSLVVAILLVADHARFAKMDPLNDPVLLELRGRLANSPGDEALAEQVRTFDLYARRAFFGNQARRQAGGRLLLGGSAVCFLAFKLYRRWMPRLPAVGRPEPFDRMEFNSLLRQLMAATAVLLVAVALFLAFAVRSDLAAVLARTDAPVSRPAAGGGGAPQASRLPGAFAANWPSLRGSGGIGVARSAIAPVAWDVETGEGVLWKTEIPVPGFNSPVVWEGRVFLTGADREGQEVFCFDAGTGELLWTRTVETAVELPEVAEDTGHAAPTMATDGQRVFAIFASGELAAFDFAGNPVWQRNLGVPKNPYGMGSSLISDGTRLFVQYDHLDAQTVLALDGATGATAWQAARTHISWSTPALIEAETGLQVVLNDERFVTAYDPATGRQLWQVECLGGEVAPSPAFNGKEIVFVANEYAQATAIRLGGAAPAILWQYDRFLPEIASPLAAEHLFFIATSAGDVVCLDAETGEAKWEQEFDDGFNASPILVGDRIYAVDLAGVVHIFEAAGEYREIAAIDMGEPVYATPAFANGRIYIRGDFHLYCVGR